MKKSLLSYLLVCYCVILQGQIPELTNYNIRWDTQSKNSSESMPCGGGDIGLNVWVEKNDILFYLSRSGTFDENNAMLKLGRVRLQLSPNPFADGNFSQELILEKGAVRIAGKGTEVSIWVDVFRPVIHADINSSEKIEVVASYESWRFQDITPVDGEFKSNSYKAPREGYDIKTYHDIIDFQGDEVLFYHQNRKDIPSIFDVTVHLQQMDVVKDQMYDPMKNLIFGGYIKGNQMVSSGITNGRYVDTDYKGWQLKSSKPARTHTVEIGLHVSQEADLNNWKEGLNQIKAEAQKNQKTAQAKTEDWWKQFWNRSYIFIEGSEQDEHWQIARNYQLFRYQLACNAYGEWPTKFNGGLFTFDPIFVDSTLHGTPDHRNWGGGIMTAQNQRLVYFPMLKSGDLDMMKPQFDFYLRSLRNAELRSEVYWGHNGACFTEQIENFGLPNIFEYGFDRPADYDPGMEYNPWLEYQWDTVFEFCLMMLEKERYEGRDISSYIPFIESCLTFYDEHYQYLGRKRGADIWTDKGEYVFYPSSACETYKMAYNPSSVIAALQVILTRMLELPAGYLTTAQKEKWEQMLHRLPPIPFRELDGHKVISPAETWQRVQNQEAPQLYPVYPWGLYGIGKPDLEVARNTYLYDPDVIRFKSVDSWMQYPIFAARLGLVDEAKELICMKLKDSDRRFPTFWGPGFDWVPDHNWGGSGMIGLQEMLMQVVDEKIYLIPAWPEDWNASFKLHAPYNTTIEATIKNGAVEKLTVLPESRRKDVIIETISSK